MSTYESDRWDLEPEVWKADHPAHEEGHGEQVAESALERRSALDCAEDAFRLLTTEPAPLAVPGSQLGHGLPARSVPLDELRDLVLSPAAGYAMQDAAWEYLARAAQSEGAAWVVGAVGVALPGLRNIAGQLALGYAGEVADLDAEVLDGFCARLKTIDPAAGMVAARLIWAAHRAGARLRAAEWDGAARMLPWGDWMEPPQPVRHPDLLLAEAVRDGVLTELEATVVGAVRIEELHLSRVAELLGCSYDQARYLRDGAEYRLVFYLTGQRPNKIRPEKIFHKFSQYAA
jgi:hypothetical protein